MSTRLERVVDVQEVEAVASGALVGAVAMAAVAAMAEEEVEAEAVTLHEVVAMEVETAMEATGDTEVATAAMAVTGVMVVVVADTEVVVAEDIPQVEDTGTTGGRVVTASGPGATTETATTAMPHTTRQSSLSSRSSVGWLYLKRCAPQEKCPCCVVEP